MRRRGRERETCIHKRHRKRWGDWEIDKEWIFLCERKRGRESGKDCERETIREGGREISTRNAIFFSLFMAENCFSLVRTAESRGLSGATPSS